MANLDILAPFILSFEGGFVCHPLDRGGATNKGVTLKTWQAAGISSGSCSRSGKRCGFDKNGDGVIDVEDLKRITDRDVIELVMRPHFWDVCGGDRLNSQSVANILVDWVWGSGRAGIVNVQRMLGVKADGVVGPRTLEAINAADARGLFELIKEQRKVFLENIVKRNPSQKVFLKGWRRRLDSIGFGYLIYNGRSERVCFADCSD